MLSEEEILLIADCYSYFQKTREAIKKLEDYVPQAVLTATRVSCRQAYMKIEDNITDLKLTIMENKIKPYLNQLATNFKKKKDNIKDDIHQGE